ncbi:MAG: tyrosine-type recombinase/integrase [Sulfuritalea sp.]|nr:tyrosine-type recombinase/integrase [Sulfuritalea sp.]
MALTDTAIRNTKPQAKSTKLADGDGLYLLVNPNGSKWWRLDYRIDGKRKTLSMGVYPDVSLKLARERRQEARSLLATGADPGEQRKAQKKAKAEIGSNTFEAIAREWMATRGKEWTESYAGKTKSALERHAFPAVGARAITEITSPHLLALLRAIESRGIVDMAHRIQQHCGAIFRYAIATGRATNDPVPSLKGSLSTVKQEHYAALTDPAEYAALLRDIDAYRGEATTKAAMQLLALTFQRTKEVRFAEWSQFDLEGGLWRIPAEIMKMREAHIVPLSQQSIDVLKRMQPLTGEGRLVFPSSISRERPISENTVVYALARMGYKGRMTGHGFRSVASTLLNEQGYRHDVIERQLAHAEKNAVRAAYNRAEYLPERKSMMQEWADYLDKLKAGAVVIPLHGHVA